MTVVASFLTSLALVGGSVAAGEVLAHLMTEPPAQVALMPADGAVPAASDGRPDHARAN